MKISGSIRNFPSEVKILIASFLFVLSIGFITGLSFVKETSADNPEGIQERYLGNEFDEDADVMKFKKTSKEMLNIVHTHILSMSIIFFLVGGLLCTTTLNRNLKLLLIIEPFISVILTFGGLYLLWSGVLWMKYVVMISGILMTLAYFASVAIIYAQLNLFSSK